MSLPNKLPSYKLSDCCGGADCDLEDSEDGPCWGKVRVVDEIQLGDDDYRWVHYCEGHEPLVYDEPYKQSTYPEDQCQ